jgi:hypothetical protein
MSTKTEKKDEKPVEKPKEEPPKEAPKVEAPKEAPKPESKPEKPVKPHFDVGDVVFLKGDIGEFSPMTVIETVKIKTAGKPGEKGDLRVLWLDSGGCPQRECLPPTCFVHWKPKKPEPKSTESEKVSQ